jgi:hypothetical protein
VDKTLLTFLGAGASVSWCGTSLGYTRGISITPEIEVQNYKHQELRGEAHRIVRNLSFTIRIGMLEASSANIGLFLLGSDVDTTGALIATGKLKSNKTLTITFLKVALDRTDTTELRKDDASVFPVTFKSYLNPATSTQLTWTIA